MIPSPLVVLLWSCALSRVIGFAQQGEQPLALKDAAPFPVGTVWSSGHSAWENMKGTDLGGPSNVFAPGTFNNSTPAGWDWSTIIPKVLDEEREHEVLKAEFNSISSEVALKPHNIAVEPDQIDFREADAMVAFAEENNMRVHGHVLLFHMSVPEWALEYEANGTWTAEQWEEWLEKYTKTVIGRYRGRIASWDILNEIGLFFGGGLKTDEMFWWRVIGDDYIEKAFLWAEQADPNAKLFINDHLMAFFPNKLRDVLDLANDLRSRGVKVDGIGFQGHLLDGLFHGGYDMHKKAMKTASDEGYLVHLSELDLCVNALGIFHGEQTFWQHRLQRKSYNAVSRSYRDGVAPENQWGITLWNISDPNSFLNIVKAWYDLRIFGGPEYPLLWDSDYNPKPAYYGFRNGLQGKAEGWFWPPIDDTN